jgi:hypothetical protein
VPNRSALNSHFPLKKIRDQPDNVNASVLPATLMSVQEAPGRWIEGKKYANSESFLKSYCLSSDFGSLLPGSGGA